MKQCTMTTAAIATLLGPAAAAQPVTLTVDPAQSSISVSIELITPLGNRTSVDDSAVVGSATIELDNATTPTSLTLNDYSFAAQDTLNFVFDYSFLGSVTATGTRLGLELPAGGAATTGPLDGAGAFSLVGVPTQIVGVIDSSGSGAIGGTIGNVMTDLGTTAPATLDTNGTVSIVGDQVTLTITVPLDSDQVVTDGVTANVTGSATVVATGTIEQSCLADVNENGVADPGDFTAWVAAYNQNLPSADQNKNGTVEPGDFTAWVANYNAGC